MVINNFKLIVNKNVSHCTMTYELCILILGSDSTADNAVAINKFLFDNSFYGNRFTVKFLVYGVQVSTLRFGKS